jgi:hypothetical protein
MLPLRLALRLPLAIADCKRYRAYHKFFSVLVRAARWVGRHLSDFTSPVLGLHEEAFPLFSRPVVEGREDPVAAVPRGHAQREAPAVELLARQVRGLPMGRGFHLRLDAPGTIVATDPKTAGAHIADRCTVERPLGLEVVLSALLEKLRDVRVLGPVEGLA